jgi:hypothetical protein
MDSRQKDWVNLLILVFEKIKIPTDLVFNSGR